MLIKRTDVDLPVFFDFVRHPDAGQNIESEILSLCAGNSRVAVDPTQTESARNVWNEPPVRPDEIVTAAEIDAEIMIFDASKNWLRHHRQTKLIVAAGPAVCVVHSPANPSGDKLRPDLVAVRITEHSEQISRLNRNFESRRIERLNLGLFLGGKERLNDKRHSQNSGDTKFHLARND